MINKREKLQYAYVFTLDLVTLFISVLLAWLITDGLLGRIVPYSISDWVQTICLVVVAFIMTFFFFNQRENIVTRSTGREFALSVRFNVLMAAVYSSLMLLAKAEMLDSRYFAVAVPLVNALMMPAAHMLLKQYLLRSQNRSGMESLAGVLSTVDHASAVIRELRDDWSKRVCGVVLLDAPAEQVGQEFEGVPVRANFDNFMDWIRRAALDEVYVDIPMDSGESFIPYLEEMESMGLTVHFRLKMLDRIEEVCCDETSAARLRRELGRCAGGNIVTMGTIELELRDMMLKRIMDIAGALVGCLISIPIIAIVAIPLKLESPGPLIFKQKRVGLNGRYFYIHKLRSMYVDAEARKKELMAQNEMNGLMFKMEDDPRITKVGKFIRRTSIDELPQFFDVLMGKMSLVGTRPPTVDEYKQYESHHKRRLSMKPGITGLWQISGRSDIDNFEEVVKLDVKYIDHWSLWGDVKILLKTVVVVFAGRGAK
ncbi:MAG: sugar transferase [Gemmiger sp.]|uniref:sugar transferase n=1 Tax=Gemmiger sp. TaxID=2049027 RepID=UPI002E76052A|nr:sugar transferase [Gemmiger sp.]MEE0707931.1 sugar transferase [Gemmiger sp.]